MVSFTGQLMSGDMVIAEIIEGRITPIAREQMPLYLARGGPLENWLESRAIDRHRPNSRILKKMLRLTDTSDSATVLRANAATITDDFWLRPSIEPELRYDQVRFTENHFAELALWGSFDSFGKGYSPEQLRSRTPELTNIGSFEKCWRLEDGAWWMHKRGSAEERFSELFICALGKHLGFSMADYLAEDGHIKTRDFTEGKWNYEPAAALVGDEEEYRYNYQRIAPLAPGLGRQYLDILYMDALCFNVDRHTYNYGFLRERNSGVIAAMAPNFDNNIALISRGYTSDSQKTNGLLITMFTELLEQESLTYPAPALKEASVRTLADGILPEEDIDRTYVVGMVMDRYQRLSDHLQRLAQKLEDPAPQQSL